MADIKKISLFDVMQTADLVANRIIADFGRIKSLYYYPVPRGGIPAALAIAQRLARKGITAVATTVPDDANIIIDDLIDSGATRQRFEGQKFYALFNKNEFEGNPWIVFPWEASSDDDASADDIPRRLLQYIGEDANREGLAETPRRFLKAMRDKTRGYDVDPESVLKVFKDGAEGCDEMVIRMNIPVYSMCEHHMADIFGSCTVAYIPDGKVVGLSKLDRLVDVFARRLQVQERLTNQIADAIDEHLKPLGVGVWMSCRHMCIESRGVKHQDSTTVTSALRGAIKEETAARAEFLAAARNTGIRHG